jgi:hypothetical protein
LSGVAVSERLAAKTTAVPERHGPTETLAKVVKSESPDNGPRTDKPNHKRALARAEKL